MLLWGQRCQAYLDLIHTNCADISVYINPKWQIELGAITQDQHQYLPQPDLDPQVTSSCVDSMLYASPALVTKN